MSKTLPSVEEVIAHRGNMLLLDRLCGSDEMQSAAEYTPRPDAWYADASGNMPAWIGIELMAQTIAAHMGMQKFGDGLPPKQGVLLGTRSYKADVPVFDNGQCLRTEVRVSFRDESGLGAFDCRIVRTEDGRALATAMLKVYEPEDFDAFMKGKHP